MSVGQPPEFRAEFDLTDHFGRAASNSDFLGEFLLVYFGFTNCKVVCPRSLAKLSSVVGRLVAEGHAIQPLYLTVDPERDTPEVMRRYLAAAFPHFLGLTGTRQQVDEAKANFRIFAERKPDPDDPEGYEVPHTAIAYLIDPAGEYCGHFPDHLDEELVFDRIKSILAAHEA
ncbi:SCO family protein [Parasphingorhabdus sp.]|uniref:SCO family protein n=1 Tax=Parasphingorhabdus sp. TaxID=2709688 RepID=UPI0032ECA695